MSEKVVIKNLFRYSKVSDFVQDAKEASKPKRTIRKNGYPTLLLLFVYTFIAYG
jgi:hypothetical protein